MNILIVTRDLPPTVCGIGDHSVLLAERLQARGHRATLLAGTGTAALDRMIVERFWEPDRLAELRKTIELLLPDRVVLEYTPLAFALEGSRCPNHAFTDFWADLGRERCTILILHETYFVAWWHAPSWITGPMQRKQLRRLVHCSHHVLTASHPLFEEVRQWSDQPSYSLLPLGTTIPVAPVDRGALRARYGIPASTRVLTLFGGGENLRRMKRHVEAVDAACAERALPVRWQLLGGIPGDWFSLRHEILRPGFLDVGDLSAHLQLSDLFLVPHLSGLCAKRSGLVAALAHGLPVVGTRGLHTDDFWEGVTGVTLVERRPRAALAHAAADLAADASRCRQHGASNREFFGRHFTWDAVVDTFLLNVA